MAGSWPFWSKWFPALGIPPAFTDERPLSVSHSFGSEIEATAHSTWFHFLCNHIALKPGPSGPEVVYHPQTAPQAPATTTAQAAAPVHPGPPRQANYSYLRSGFVLRKEVSGSVTLVCCGASLQVRKTLRDFVQGGSWRSAILEPYVLFDLVLEGLFMDVDTNTWNINDVFASLEHVRNIVDIDEIRIANKHRQNSG